MRQMYIILSYVGWIWLGVVGIAWMIWRLRTAHRLAGEPARRVGSENGEQARRLNEITNGPESSKTVESHEQ